MHAAGELGDWGAGFVFDGRGGLEVVAVEQLVFLAGVVAAAVSPGRLGVRAAVVVVVGGWGSVLGVGVVRGVARRGLRLGVARAWLGVSGVWFGWWA